jgi:hypothetical protein
MDKTTKSELGKIKRLLDSKKALTLAEMTQVVGFLKKHGMELMLEFDELATKTVEKCCSVANDSGSKRAKAILDKLLEYPALASVGHRQMSECAIKVAGDKELARKICTEYEKSIEMSMLVGLEMKNSGADKKLSSLLEEFYALSGDKDNLLRKCRESKIQIQYDKECFYTPLATTVLEVIGDKKWALDIVKAGVEKALSFPNRPVASVSELVKFTKNELKDPKLARKICEKASKKAKKFQEMADLFILAKYILGDKEWGNQVFNECYQKAKAWQEQLWMAEIFSHDGVMNEPAKLFYSNALALAKKDRSATQVIAESIQKSDIKWAGEILKLSSE